ISQSKEYGAFGDERKGDRASFGPRPQLGVLVAYEPGRAVLRRTRPVRLRRRHSIGRAQSLHIFGVHPDVAGLGRRIAKVMHRNATTLWLGNLLEHGSDWHLRKCDGASIR